MSVASKYYSGVAENRSASLRSALIGVKCSCGQLSGLIGDSQWFPFQIFYSCPFTQFCEAERAKFFAEDHMKSLIVWGGWEGHEPDKVASAFKAMLEAEGISVEVSDTLQAFADIEALKELDLIVPIWTMGEIDKELVQNVSRAVGSGTGLGGCHGGMCDAFRDSVLWQFMTGANWVAHPGGDGIEYRVKIAKTGHKLVRGIEDFDVKSEQYYLHVDPAINVLATTRFPSVEWYHSPNGKVDMPVAWTKYWGHGRIYYNALGHHADVIDDGPAYEMLRRGLKWAAKGKARAKGRSTAQWDNDFSNL